jgi:lytic murein transglycosylase
MDRRTFLFSASGLAIAPALALDSANGADPLFDAWKQGFIDRAVGAGWSRPQLDQVFDGVTADPSVIANDHRQPELSKPVGDYIAATVSAGRIAQGQSLRYQDAVWLDPIVATYGVPAEILIAVWAMESNYGRFQGGYDVIRSLATLAAEGRRRDWAEGQLFAALRILFTGAATRSQLTGSWAGAMGQTQFTPSDYLAWAVDGDGDGRRDIWTSAPDALASSANFLAHKAAWRRGEPWTYEVILPAGFDYSLAEGPKQPMAAWAALGVRPATPYRPDPGEVAQLLLPAGWTGPAFLAFPNHFAIRAYNNSMAYALAVGLIADGVAGQPGVVKPWPQEPPLTLADRIAAQEALTRLGFDVGAPDGVLGLKTRQAARAWQKSRNLPADGYLNLYLIQQLKADGGVSTPSSAPAPSYSSSPSA